MRRLGGFALAVAIVSLLVGPWLVQAQVPALRVIVVDPTGTHTATVLSSGHLATSASVTVDTISHISSAVHVAGIGTTVNVNCTAGCTGSSHLAVTQTTQRWNVAHVTSLTHVVIVDWQRWAHLAAAQSGVWSVTAHQGGTWTVQTQAEQSGSWTVQAAHVAPNSGHLSVTQAGQWTVAHIGGAVHVAGIGTTVNVNCTSGCTGSSHLAVTQGAQAWTVAHISSVVHVNLRNFPRDAHLGAAQSGAWNVTAHQGGSWAASVSHISGALHIAGIANTVHVSATMAVNGWHVAVTQAGEQTVAHISSAVHVAAIAQPVHVVGISIANSTYPIPCHSSMSFHTSARATTIAHANSGMKIYICGLLLINQAADSISIVEGSGTACATGRQELIGHTVAALALPATGGFSSIHPFPWINSKVTGNAVCVIKGRADQHVSGVITYRGAP